ncbi:MAG: sodium:proton antiporter NhaD [Alphaproteobacteria bacterium]|nr:sodium:proton antiporter NhaD [Alphaproteobacteria bacterium]
MLRFISSFLAFFLMFPAMALANGGGEEAANVAHMQMHPGAMLCIVVFILSYALVFAEEYIHMRKSKPVMLGAGIIWVIIAIIAPSYGIGHEQVRKAVFSGLEEYASLLLFLLAAMTYISALEERQVFNVLKNKLIGMGLNLRQLFWATGTLAFFISPVADNLTTALVLGTVAVAVGAGNGKFITLACINVVNAANAGGAFCPFGDITTLMVWQAEKVEFFEFFDLFIPSAVCYLVPAIIMSFFIPKDKPLPPKDTATLKPGAMQILFLGIMTIGMAVTFEQALGLPPFVGMMTGMSLLMIYSWIIQYVQNSDRDFDILDNVASAEWDTLLFFFGVIFSVGGLGYIGYLEVASHVLYGDWGATNANIAVGFLSAIVDNIPVMFAVLTMDPDMPHFQWMLVTLTAGIGGSLLSIGSAAGVALMGVGRGYYTFFSHLRWTPVIAIGYAAAIAAHFIFNAHLMNHP